MRKTLLTVLMVCMLLSLAATPAAAKRPTEVSGTFDYLPTIVDIQNRGGNTIMQATDIEWWTGDLVGAATSEYKAIFHRSGVATFSAKGVFVGSVLGSEEGTLQYQLNGVLQAGATEWQGSWRMGQGTGGLEGIHAGGRWWGPGFPGPSPMCTYEGRVH